jgi:hypothetical protein
MITCELTPQAICLCFFVLWSIHRYVCMYMYTGLEVPSKGAAWLPKTHAPRFKESDIDPALAQFVRGHIGQTLERFGY